MGRGLSELRPSPQAGAAARAPLMGPLKGTGGGGEMPPLPTLFFPTEYMGDPQETSLSLKSLGKGPVSIRA